MKTLGYYVFAIVYYLCKPLPVRKKKVFCITTHDDGKGSNVNIVKKALEEKGLGYTFSYIKKSETLEVKQFKNIRTIFSFFIIKPYEMAKAEIILMDNVFIPMAFFRVKKATMVVQLWHGTGTIKKFGQDANQGRLKKLEKRANANITHLIVNSNEMKDLYAGAFGISKNRIYPIGLPKTDELFYKLKNRDEETLDRNKSTDKEWIYKKYSIPEDKKLILYAPTFRDCDENRLEVVEKIREIALELPQEYYLGVRLHPFVAHEVYNHKLTNGEDRIINMSFEEEQGVLLMASDILITDYSSIIFEYSLTERPVIFFAYDLHQYEKSDRGFYYNYQSYVPGPIVQTGKELGKLLAEGQISTDVIKEFKQKNFPYLDGKAIERLINLFD